MTRRRRGRVKKGESNLASNQFPMCSPQCEHSDRFMELYREEKRRRRKETEVTRRQRGEVKRRETNLASNQLHKCASQARTPGEIHRV